MWYWLFADQPDSIFLALAFRTACAALTALFVSIAFGPLVVRKLKALDLVQPIREEGPASHNAKSGTPTMGGLLTIASVTVATLLWSDLNEIYVWVALLALIGFGAVGFWDDCLKIIRKKNHGLPPRQKTFAQVAVSLTIAFILPGVHPTYDCDTTLNFPLLKNGLPELVTTSPILGHWMHWIAFFPYVAFVVFILVVSSSSVNFTDGLDGLASGLMFISFCAMSALCYFHSHCGVKGYPSVLHVPAAGELMVLCGSAAAASLGFLWFNVHPAKIFMGDVGALGLGGCLGTTAVLLKEEFLLVVIGGVYLIELLSVVLQVGSYRLRGGKRIFKMAPLHHHFEALGWSEMTIVVRFWIAGFVLAIFALATLGLRQH